MPSLMDMAKNMRSTVKANAANWRGVVQGSAKSAGLGSGDGPLGMGILGGGGGGLQLGKARQKIGDMIAGRSTPAGLGSTRVFVSDGSMVAGNATKQYGPVIP